MQRAFPKSYDSLQDIHDYLRVFYAQHDLSDTARYTLDLAVEELFTNMVKYAPESARDIDVKISCDGATAELCLVDHEVAEYDVTQAPAVDPQRPTATIKPGGLGIHLIRNMAQDFRYDYINGDSIVTVVVRLDD